MINIYLISTVLLSASAFEMSGRFRDPLAWSGGLSGLGINPNYTAGTFPTKLDHFNDDIDKMFELRFWINDNYYDVEHGPIFIYICGEWTCSPPADDATAMAFGASRGALLVALEHRYYGASQPFPDWSYENLKWLTTPQAIEDIHGFVLNIK